MQTIPQKYILNWYHTYLLHLRMDRTKATTSQHFYMPNIMDEVFARIIYFKNCQKKYTKQQIWPFICKVIRGHPLRHIIGRSYIPI